MKNPELRAQNRRALVFLLLGLALAAVLASLPLFHFSAVVYTKKSPNTFVGDATYQSVKAEVEALAESYREQGLEVSLRQLQGRDHLARQLLAQRELR